MLTYVSVKQISIVCKIFFKSVAKDGEFEHRVGTHAGFVCDEVKNGINLNLHF